PLRARRSPVRLAIAANAAIDDGRAATPAAAIIGVVITGSAIGDRRAYGHARDQRYADSGGSGAEIVVGRIDAACGLDGDVAGRSPAGQSAIAHLTPAIAVRAARNRDADAVGDAAQTSIAGSRSSTQVYRGGYNGVCSLRAGCS